MQVIDFKDAKCRHCYKCVRHCAVKAICVRDEQARIMVDHCITSGGAWRSVPECEDLCQRYGAGKRVSETGMPDSYLHRPVLCGVLDYDRPGQVVDALAARVQRGARGDGGGAALVTDEYKKLIREGRMPNIITTCCPSVNDLIENIIRSARL